MRKVFALIIALALITAACGDDDSGSTSAVTDAPTAMDAPVGTEAPAETTTTAAETTDHRGHHHDDPRA